MSPFLLAIAVVLLAVYLYGQAYIKPPNFPPGPPRLPFWGSYWLLLLENYKFAHIGFMKLADKYKSKVLGFFIGVFPSVVACDYEGVREILQRPEFQGRADLLIARVRSMGERYGLFFTDGPEWAEQRRFFLRYMRDNGFGRRFEKTENMFQEELRDMVDLLNGDWKDEEVCKGGEVLFSQLFIPYALNSIWCMFGGERFPRKDHQMLRAVGLGTKYFLRSTDPLGRAVSMTPWLQHLPPGGFGVEDVRKSTDVIRDFVKKQLLEHKATFSDSYMRDYIDMFLRKAGQKNGELEEAVFKDEQLVMTATDMLMATTGTLPAAMTFLFYCLLHHPEMQKKMQDQLDEVVGRDKLPTLDDRQRLPYIEATIRESMRRITVVPLSIPHMCTEDTKFRGYSVPKNTVMLTNLWAAHMDPKVWGDPENFRPERFLDESGSLNKKDPSMPFGAGKRLCAGETFSRQIMFLFTAGLLQNFSFEPKDPAKLYPIDTFNNGFTLVPRDDWVKIIPRK